MRGRTWMKLSNSSYTFWIGVEYDSIVATEPPGMGFDHERKFKGMRADDTLSQLRRDWKIEGPFDAPE